MKGGLERAPYEFPYSNIYCTLEQDKITIPLQAICPPVILTRHAPGVQYLPAWGHRPLKMTGQSGATICCIKFCGKCGKLVKLQSALEIILY